MKSIQLAESMKEMDAQAVAQNLGFDAAIKIVGDMLYALLPEEAVIVAIDGLREEHARITLAEERWKQENGVQNRNN